jgi:hypothetical protein
MANLVLAGEQVAPTSIESALSHYLKVDVLREQRVEPAARALEAAIAKHGFPDAAPTDLLELRYDDGFVHYISVERFLEDQHEERESRRSRGAGKLDSRHFRNSSSSTASECGVQAIVVADWAVDDRAAKISDAAALST